MSQSWIEDSEVRRLKAECERLGGVVKVLEKGIQTQRTSKSSNPFETLGLTFFLSHVCVFLNDMDLVKLIAASKTMKNLILSSYGYRVLFHCRNIAIAGRLSREMSSSNSLETNKNHNGNDGPTILDVSSVNALQARLLQQRFEPGEDFEAQCVAFKHAMQILSSQLITQLGFNEKLQDSINDAAEELEIESNSNKKYLDKLNVVSEKAANLEIELAEVEGKQNEEDNNQQKELEELQDDKRILEQENEALTSEKTRLEDEYEKLMESLAIVQQDKQSYLQTLKEFRALIVDDNS